MSAQLLSSDSSRCSPEYLCPGDRQPISAALHLARLSSGDARCRGCEHRTEMGSLPKFIQIKLQSQLSAHELLVNEAEGIRGEYLNTLTRERIAELTFNVYDLFDDLRRRELSKERQASGLVRVVVGYDSRPSSPDLAVGVMHALKRTGVDIIDVGQVTSPMMAFASERFRPQLMFYVTGGNRPSGWTGLDVLDPLGLNWLHGARLSQFQARINQSCGRSSRQTGAYVPAEITEDYLGMMAHQFHALRPLRVGIHCPDITVKRMLSQLLTATPCDIRWFQGGATSMTGRGKKMPPRKPVPETFAPVEVRKSLGDFVCQGHLDFGVELSPDGRESRFCDESGTSLHSDDVVAMLMAPYTNLPDDAAMKAAELRQTEPAITRLRERQRSAGLPVVADESQRYWFDDEFSGCDAVMTLARVLDVLSLAERPMSYFRTIFAKKSEETPFIPVKQSMLNAKSWLH